MKSIQVSFIYSSDVLKSDLWFEWALTEGQRAALVGVMQ